MLEQASHRLQLAAARIIPQRRRSLQELTRHRLLPAGKRIVPERRRILQNLARTLNALSPLPTLARGYAIVTDAQTGTAISSVRDVKPKQALLTQLSDGQILSTTEKVNDTPA
jgi:exodeoxyribonuclease VII large subunit